MVLLFDVYETLLDMTEVQRKVNDLMDSKRGYELWFELFMQYCFVDNCTVQFNKFSTIAEATMNMCAARMRVSISNADIDEVLNLLRHLPLHEDVIETLSELNDQGHRIAALTNSDEAIVTERMERTGLISYFEKVLSAEHVKKYKPSREVYQYAAKCLGVSCEEVTMVTSHGWDVAGAANAGMKTIYLKRSDAILYPLAPKPTAVVARINDLGEVLEVTEG